MLLQNKKEVMGPYKASLGFNIVIGIIFIFTVLMAITGIIGIKNIL